MRPALVARLLAAAAVPFPSAWAWGGLGHRTVGYLAELQFSDAGQRLVQRILAPELAAGRDISDAAVWADEIKGDARWAWSRGLHFMGGGSTELPLVCNATQCAPAGCITSAIANVTEILARAGNDAALELEALRFLVHFVGDIHQPLHANNLKRGGNDIFVTFNGTEQLRLHGAWDDFIPRAWNGLEALVDDPGREKTAAKAWALRLHSAAKTGGGNSGSGAGDSGGDADCTDPARRDVCPAQWALESNRAVCETVLADGIEWVQAHDLFTSAYYTRAAPVVEARIRAAGARLARWVDGLAAARGAVVSDEL